jgi:hypothetical protein
MNPASSETDTKFVEASPRSSPLRIYFETAQEVLEA